MKKILIISLLIFLSSLTSCTFEVRIDNEHDTVLTTNEHCHTYEWVCTVQPTCEDVGQEQYICCGSEGCGDVQNNREIPALGHTYPVEPTNVFPSTCMHNGAKEFACQNCGKIKSESIEKLAITTKNIALTIAIDCEFSEVLTENKSYLEKMFPQLNGAFTDCMAYIPAGITPEEIFVYKITTEADVSKVKDALVSYVVQQKADYADYAPLQVPKLDNAVITTNSKYVIYTCSENNGATQTLVQELLDIIAAGE